MAPPNAYTPQNGFGPPGGTPLGGYAPPPGPFPQNGPGIQNGFGVQNGFPSPSEPGAQNGFGQANGYPPRQEGFAPPAAPAGGPFPGAGQPLGGPWQQPGGFPGPQQPYGQVSPMGQAGYQDPAQFARQPTFGGGPAVTGAPQFPGGPPVPGGPQGPGGPRFPGGQQFQAPPPPVGQPQPGFGQRLGPDGPGGPMPGGPAPGGFGGPAVRRRITDAWVRLGTLTPAAGRAAVRRTGRNGDAGPANVRQPSPTRNKALVAGAGVLAVLAVGGVIAAPRLLGGGSTDPGCTAYSGATLTAYNKAITDLNAQASQSVLSTDMSAAITGLTNAVGQSKSASVKSALSGLLTEVQAVNTGIRSGSVSASTVAALNAASAKADNACLGTQAILWRGRTRLPERTHGT
ncbi:MAG: hypothetical protein ACRDNW_07155 [Trebonia sp.]